MLKANVALLFISGSLATAAAVPLGDHEACLDGPIAEFGRYVGDWKIEDESLARDGSGWQPGPGARWLFVCVGVHWLEPVALFAGIEVDR